MADLLSLAVPAEDGPVSNIGPLLVAFAVIAALIAVAFLRVMRSSVRPRHHRQDDGPEPAAAPPVTRPLPAYDLNVVESSVERQPYAGNGVLLDDPRDDGEETS